MTEPPIFVCHARALYIKFDLKRLNRFTNARVSVKMS